MNLNNNLAVLVKAHNITISKLSRATSVPVQTIHNWANGHRPQDIEQLKRIADYFSLTIDEICFGSECDLLSDKQSVLTKYEHEINAGTFEVILRRVPIKED